MSQDHSILYDNFPGQQSQFIIIMIHNTWKQDVQGHKIKQHIAQKTKSLKSFSTLNMLHSKHSTILKCSTDIIKGIPLKPVYEIYRKL